MAYPTESVYGLGCDPFDHQAVMRLLAIKQRPSTKGLILIAADLEQARPLIGRLEARRWPALLASWPGPVTWVVPASVRVPPWITAADGSLAIRVTAHPIARELCLAFGGPIVSTSANRTGSRPARSALEIRLRLGPIVDAIVNGPLGGQQRPTPIYRASDGACLRA